MGRKPSRWSNLPPGMRARVRKYGTYFYYDQGGKPRKEIPLGSDYVEAVRKWAELEKQSIPPYGQATFVDALNHYRQKILPRKAPRTQQDNLKEMDLLLEFFGRPPAPLSKIEPIHVYQYLQWRVEKAQALARKKNEERLAAGKKVLPVPPGHGEVRANREIALFSHIFNFARQSGLTSATNPCVGVEKFSETGRDTYIEDDLYLRVYKAACAPLKEAMDLAYLTGQRPADVLAYSLTDIRDKTLFVQQGKTKAKVRLEITGELEQLIARIMTRRSEIQPGAVISMNLIVNERGEPLTAGALRSRFDKARETAGVEKKEFQFRDLRAKAGTDTAERGDILAARRQLGHSSVAMTEHYIRNRKGNLSKPTK